MIEQQLLSILEEQLSSLTARTLLTRCSAALGVRSSELGVQHVPEFVRKLEIGVRLFVPAEQQRMLLDRVRALASAPKMERLTVEVDSEADVAKARIAARNAAVNLGANSYVVQKIATAVSELARNIALYAGSGRIDLIPIEHPEAKLKIIASDRGPGIPDVPHVLSGRYKSKTGLGRGLISLRRMADGFDLRTGANGTTVEVGFLL